MRILFHDFDIPFLWKDAAHPIGGAAVELQVWLEGLSYHECQLGVLTFKTAKGYYQLSKKPDFDIIETYHVDKGLPFIRWIYYRIPLLYRATKRWKPNCIVKEVAGLSTGIIALICSILGIPLIYRVANDIEVDDRYKSTMPRYAQLAFQYALKTASGIVCQNHYQLQGLSHRFKDKPMTVLYNPFKVEGNGPLSKRNERSYVAWVGIFQRQKNMEALLKVVKLLPRVKFKIAGVISKTADPKTIKVIDQLKECNNVEFVGYVVREQLRGFLSNSILLLNTSHYEGFSNTFLEALSNGTPICTTTAVDPDSIVQKFGLGKVAKNHEQLHISVDAISTLNEVQYHSLSRSCLQYIQKHHNPEILGSNLIDFITTTIKDT